MGPVLSFLGYDPIAVNLQKRHRDSGGGGATSAGWRPGIPLRCCGSCCGSHRSPRLPEMPPFTGGLVGSFSYEMIGYAEPVLKLPENEGNDFDLMLFDKVIAYDHLRQKIAIVVNMKTDRVLGKLRSGGGGDRPYRPADRGAGIASAAVRRTCGIAGICSEMDEQRYGAPSGAGQKYIGQGTFSGGAVPPVRYPVQGQPA